MTSGDNARPLLPKIVIAWFGAMIWVIVLSKLDEQTPQNTGLVLAGLLASVRLLYSIKICFFPIVYTLTNTIYSDPFDTKQDWGFRNIL